MIGLIISVVMGIITLIATPTIAGMKRHKEIPSADFIRDWHKNSTELRNQNKIDSERVYEIADLWQGVIVMRDQLEIWKEQIQYLLY